MRSRRSSPAPREVPAGGCRHERAEARRKTWPAARRASRPPTPQEPRRWATKRCWWTSSARAPHCSKNAARPSWKGVARVRLHALDGELAEITASIQLLCARVGLEPPADVQPLPPARGAGLAISERLLDRHLAALRTHRTLHNAALDAGDDERAQSASLAIRADEATIREHCERSKLPLPPELRS
ncbi:MAG TPA: hypothetical protein VFT98_17450 [Myxococcota bacterium]|nr:hypothetical protein [Myxococcota bacterium]